MRRYRVTVDCSAEAVIALRKLVANLRWLGDIGASRCVSVEAEKELLEDMRNNGFEPSVFFDGDGDAKIREFSYRELDEEEMPDRFTPAKCCICGSDKKGVPRGWTLCLDCGNPWKKRTGGD